MSRGTVGIKIPITHNNSNNNIYNKIVPSQSGGGVVAYIIIMIFHVSSIKRGNKHEQSLHVIYYVIYSRVPLNNAKVVRVLHYVSTTMDNYVIPIQTTILQSHVLHVHTTVGRKHPGDYNIT